MLKAGTVMTDIRICSVNGCGDGGGGGVMTMMMMMMQCDFLEFLYSVAPAKPLTGQYN